MPSTVSELEAAWELLDHQPLNVVMIAGPYFGDGSTETIETNIREAEQYAIALANCGIGFFCPHLHTSHFGLKALADEPFYHRLDFRHLTHCDAVLFTPRWMSSSGAKREHAWAQWHGMPMFYPDSPNDLEEIMAWNGSNPPISMPRMRTLISEAGSRFIDFQALPGWSSNDQAVVDELNEIGDRRHNRHWSPPQGWASTVSASSCSAGTVMVYMDQAGYDNYCAWQAEQSAKS